jgi:hypothetical protein
MSRARHLLCGVLLAFSLLATGCFIPYAYPKLSYVRGTELGSEVSDVRVFCVDAEMQRALYKSSDCDYKPTEITPRADGTLPPQLRVTVESGVAHPTDNWYYFSGGHVHETLVRLYRPGYRLLELRSWDSTDKIVWQPAPDWRSQEQALIGLLAAPQLAPPPSAPGAQISLPTTNPSLQSVTDMVWRRFLPLAPTTPQTQRLFDLAVAECERLAKCAPTSEDAAQLRMLAQKLIERQSTASKPMK